MESIESRRGSERERGWTNMRGRNVETHTYFSKQETRSGFFRYHFFLKMNETNTKILLSIPILPQVFRAFERLFLLFFCFFSMLHSPALRPIFHPILFVSATIPSLPPFASHIIFGRFTIDSCSLRASQQRLQ